MNRRPYGPAMRASQAPRSEVPPAAAGRLLCIPEYQARSACIRAFTPPSVFRRQLLDFSGQFFCRVWISTCTYAWCLATRREILIRRMGQ